ncbi:MAG TPA: PAS domain S-box protein [Acidimicrobiia bacterium]|nr:PAS domain S-box protein [Acidimicrobiia bacterium]
MGGGDDARLREAEQRFRVAFENAPIGKALVAPDGRFLRVNTSLAEIVGYPPNLLLTKTFQEITHPEDVDADLEQVRQLLTGDIRTYSIEKRYLHADGHVVRVNLSVALVRDDDNVPLYFIAQVQDITARRRTEDALRASEQRFRQLVDTSTEAFIAMDAEGRITEWNRQAERTFGWSRDEAVGRRLGDTIIPPSFREAHNIGLAHYLATGEGPVLGQRLELEGRHRDGREFPVEFTIWALGSGPDLSFNALLHDISERRRLEEELWELALVDDLTGLHNRRSFMLLAAQTLKEAARAHRPLIALFLDVDHLKAINDTYGHAEGDRALRLVAAALQAACRESDIIGRLSGDEFAIVLAEAHEIDGLEGRVRREVAKAAEGTTYPLSVSIGVAQCQPDEPFDLADLFERADQAMYADKATKRQT